jgi:hypothetical protein
MPALAPGHAEVRYGFRTGRSRKELLNGRFRIPAAVERDRLQSFDFGENRPSPER